MAAENIGSLIPTKIPGYADDADIQAALRVYHYGSYDYNPANTAPVNLIVPSMAKTIYDIQQSVINVTASSIQSSVFTTKGSLLSASATSTPLLLSPGSNNQVLIVNSATATGLQWTNTLSDISLVAPSLTAPNIGVATGTSFNGITGLSSTTPSANGTAAVGTSATVARADHVHPINALTIGTGLSGTSYNGSSSVTIAIDSTVATLSGSQTLSNKTITAPTINGGSFNLEINAQTGTTYTTVLSDNGKLVTLSNSSAIALTIPTNLSVPYPIGAQINLVQMDFGQVTIQGDSGVTIGAATPTEVSVSPKLRIQYSSATAIKIATDSWLVLGDIV